MKTLEWLQRAYEERSRPMVYLKVDPAFDSLHSHPKFQDLLQHTAPPPLRQDIF